MSATTGKITPETIDTRGGLAALERREVPGVQPSLEWSLEYEEGDDDVIVSGFFDAMATRPALEYTWPGWERPVSRFPMAYSDVSLISATFTIPREQARALVPQSRRLKLVRLTPRRVPITVFAFDYRKGGLGRYHEVGVALPLVLDRPAPPLLPALAETLRPASWPGFGMHAVELPVDEERACEAGIRLYGLPKVVGKASFEIGPRSGRASLSYEGRKMADLEVALGGRVGAPKRLRLPFTTLTVLDGRVIETRYETVAEGYLHRTGDARFTPGDHPRFARFRQLEFSERPIEVRVIQRLNWIIWGPLDRGPT